ncbi:hypothetical protein GGR52DRAFT_555444 [Hypoxylon sp. FL1284]|nr:hypothetical protein GGR52DRAFT_555444 [Hypoxylon sp. FL1284]
MGSYEFNDARGWWYTFFHDMGKYKLGFQRQVVLHYPASLKYPTGPVYFAEDGMGRQHTNMHQRFDYTIDPSTGAFEPLCIQGRGSCRVENSTWDRTLIRNASPMTLRIARFPYQGLWSHKRDTREQWEGADWASVSARWFIASLVLGTGIPDFITWFKMLNLDDSNQRYGTSAQKYLPFRYNDRRYPRIARNPLENKADIRERQARYYGLVTNEVGTYRAIRPRYLCYLKDGWFKNEGGDWYELKPVALDDHTPYMFISYSKTQFFPDRGVDIEKDNTNMGLLMAYVWDTLSKIRSGSTHNPRAFWIDSLCQGTGPHNKHTAKQNEGTDPKEKDYDVYTMSDIIRGAEHSIILSQITSHAKDQDFENEVWKQKYAGLALKLWGRRVWTLPEVLLSRGDTVSIMCISGRNHEIQIDVDKVRLAEMAWDDAPVSRQLVEHFRTLPLSRLEFVRFAVKCIHNRHLEMYLPGDRSYALMGLLRLRPPIDATDSAFTAFARLSLAQDSDRLMERLICLQPKSPQDPWASMSDQYNASLWDIYPSTQVCGVGENDTVIVDGFKGAIIQWSKFPALGLFNRMTLGRILVMHFVGFVAPFVLIIGIALAANQVPGPWTAIFIIGWLAISISLPLWYKYLFGGKLWNVEPGLFGVEGYVPLQDLEEKLFGLGLHRLQWSTNGSPLSRHRVRRGFEAGCEEYRSEEIVDEGFSPRAELGRSIHTYPIEGVDPLSKCVKCEWGNSVDCDAHQTSASADTMANSRYGEMKLFTLIDTVSMTATLFQAAGPPVALLVGGEEGGMQRALACSYDITTGTMHRESVLRLPTGCLDAMHTMPRIRLGLKSSFKLHNQESTPSTAYGSPMATGNDQYDHPSYSSTTLEEKIVDIPLINHPDPPSTDDSGMAKGWKYQKLG